MSCVTYHIPSVNSYLSPVTCYQYQQPQPQTVHLLNSPLCTLGWFDKTPKPQTLKKMLKCLIVKTFEREGVLTFAIFAITFLTRIVQSTRFRFPSDGTTYINTYIQTDNATYRLNRPRSRFSEHLRYNKRRSHSISIISNIILLMPQATVPQNSESH